MHALAEFLVSIIRFTVFPRPILATFHTANVFVVRTCSHAFLVSDCGM